MSVAKIAKVAGVSPATVSRVLNNHPAVRRETKEQVRKVISDFHYTLPASRRSARGEERSIWRTGNIAVLAFAAGTRQRQLRVPIFAAALEGIIDSARELDLKVIVDDVPDSAELPRAVRQREVDGVLAIVPANVEAAMPHVEAIGRYVPVVRAMGEAIGGHFGIDHVGPDNVAVGRAAYEYLASRGCAELAFVTTWPQWAMNYARAAGFAAAATREGKVLPACYFPGKEPQIQVGHYGQRVVSCRSNEELADHLVTSSTRAKVGLFISRDRDALPLWPLLKERGLRPGTENFEVISCDNDEALLSMLDPRPPSIDLCPEQVGRRAVARLGGRIRQPNDPPFRTLVLPQVVMASPNA